MVARDEDDHLSKQDSLFGEEKPSSSFRDALRIAKQVTKPFE